MTTAEMTRAIRKQYRFLNRLSCRMLISGMVFYNKGVLLRTVKRRLEQEVGSCDDMSQYLYNHFVQHDRDVLLGKIRLCKDKAIPKSNNLGLD